MRCIRILDFDEGFHVRAGMPCVVPQPWMGGAASCAAASFGAPRRGAFDQCSSAGVPGAACVRSTVAAMPLAMMSAMPSQPISGMASPNSTTL